MISKYSLSYHFVYCNLKTSQFNYPDESIIRHQSDNVGAWSCCWHQCPSDKTTNRSSGGRGRSSTVWSPFNISSLRQNPTSVVLLFAPITTCFPKWNTAITVMFVFVERKQENLIRIYFSLYSHISTKCLQTWLRFPSRLTHLVHMKLIKDLSIFLAKFYPNFSSIDATVVDLLTTS